MDEVIAQLGRLKAVYEKVRQCALVQQRAIIKADTAALEEANAAQRGFADEISALDDGREALVAALCAKMGWEKGDVSSLCALAGADGARLRKAADELLGVISEVSEINGRNAELLKLHFDYVDHMMSVATESRRVSNIYGASGQEDDGAIGAVHLFSTEV